jgi:hypothetical protein
MSLPEACCYSQDKGNIIVSSDDVSVAVPRDDVPTLLLVVMTALRTGGYSEEQLDLCSRVCWSNLGEYL